MYMYKLNNKALNVCLSHVVEFFSLIRAKSTKIGLKDNNK